MVVGLIGATITPWMQFYLQASIVEKISARNSTRLPSGT
jgi:Mn2+/Fe2+ NRAMP family transporter